MFECKEGSVILMRQKADGYKHLTIILCDPDSDYRIVIVNITKYREDKDPTCILHRDDHPWLYYDQSCVKYDSAEIVDANKIEDYINHGYGEVEECFDDDIFLDILCCAFESQGTKIEVKDFLSKIIDYDLECADSDEN